MRVIIPIMTLQQFENFDEMIAAMSRDEENANSVLTEQQREVGWGDYWIRVLGDYGLVIFGHVSSLRELRKDLIENGCDEEEVAEEIASISEGYERGYRFGPAYSVACPEGELGDTHIANMVGKISKAEFVCAQECDWDLPRTLESSPTLRNRLSKLIAPNTIG